MRRIRNEYPKIMSISVHLAENMCENLSKSRLRLLHIY